MRVFRYLFKEVLGSFVGVSTLLIVIFVSSTFVRYLADAASGRLPSDIVFAVLMYRLPGFLELIVPLSLFLGVMLAFGRLYVESEMIVLQACGLSKMRLMMYSQGLAVIVMVLVAALTLYIAPLGMEKYYDVKAEAETQGSFNTVVAGSFKQFGGSDVVLYAGEVTDNKTLLSDVFVAQSLKTSGPNKISLVKAKEGRIVNKDGHRYLELEDGVQISGDIQTNDLTVTRYDIFGYLVEEQQDEEGPLAISDIDAKSTVDLIGSKKRKEQAALQWRIGLPFMVPVIALIAFAMSETSHRRGRYFKLLPGIILYFVYFVSATGVKTLIEDGKMPADLGLWPVHLLFLLVGFGILFMSEIRHRLFHRGKGA
ncbi:Lipopolysaccharide export system permease protein LptF [BD1-7 clade bacterium]|uniref:Lipopolysaccharide export system permease protein LptF n=1 Tax=BD1-7 clade bacterium TaxID=2029982 RepID=A0A5S9R092_9GAMM|nr:Lipopolysaccharide export system permease protein LptF [BD1-7 clade bacterium]